MAAVETINITGIVFTVALAVLAGIIAYASDRVGWRVAKRKISVFGLRPRIVSTGIAILTGILLALGTLGALLVGSQNVREMILEFDQLQADLTEVNNKLRTAENRLAEARRERQQAQTELENTRSEMQSLDQRISMLQTQLDSKNRELSELQAELNESREELNSLERRNRRAREKLSEQREEFQQEIDQLQQTRDRLRVQIENLESELTELREERDVLRNRKVLLYRRNPLLYQQIPDGLSHEELMARVQQSMTELREQSRVRNLEVESPTDQEVSDVAGRLAEIDGPTTLIIFAEQNIFMGEELKVDFAAVDPEKVVYTQGEELVRFRVPQGATEEEVATIIEQQLTRLKSQAINEGVLPKLDDLTVGEIPQETVNSWISRLSGLQENVVASLEAGRAFRVRDRIDDLNLKLLGPAPPGDSL